MRKHIILFFSALLVLGACKSARTDADVLGADDMVSLLVDMHLVDGYLSQQPNNDSVYVYGKGLYKFTFQQHYTDSATFRRSFKYYTMHDEKLVKIYDEVNKRLQVKNDSMLVVIRKEQELVQKQAQKAQKEQERKAKLRQDSISKKYQADLIAIRKDSIAKAKKDSIKNAQAAAKKTLLKPKKTNTKIK